MTRFAEIQGHIASMRELRDIVGAMRSLAGMRVQEAQRALSGIRSYADTMAGAIGTALLLVPQPPPEARTARTGRAVILFTAEHGFVGGFNERLVEAAEAALAPKDALFVLGSRGAVLVPERGRRAAWASPMATRLAGLTEVIHRLQNELYRRIARGEILRIEVMFARYHPGSAPAVERHLLLPLDLAALATTRSRQPPLHNLAPQPLLERLMSEYVFARLTEAGVESIASENAARFAAMESAHDNVAKKLDQLRQEARQARQNEITTELIELVTGAEALEGR
jgi:F-type H+-transporting ATPase subunit gamma